MDNFTTLADNYYLVINQNGFKDALKVFDPNKELEPGSYPTFYPCLVSFTAGYYDHHFTQVATHHLNDLKANNVIMEYLNYKVLDIKDKAYIESDDNQLHHKKYIKEFIIGRYTHVRINGITYECEVRSTHSNRFGVFLIK